MNGWRVGRASKITLTQHGFPAIANDKNRMKAFAISQDCNIHFRIFWIWMDAGLDELTQLQVDFFIWLIAIQEMVIRAKVYILQNVLFSFHMMKSWWHDDSIMAYVGYNWPMLSHIRKSSKGFLINISRLLCLWSIITHVTVIEQLPTGVSKINNTVIPGNTY